MAFDSFLKIDGIEGDATDKDHIKWIPLESWSHGVLMPIGGIGSGQQNLSAGKVDFSDFTFSKRVDIATPLLAKYCCQGRVIPSMKLDLCRAINQAGGAKEVFQTYEFKNALVSNVSNSGSAGTDIPMETVSIRFSEYKSQHKTYSTDGAVANTQRMGWSIEQDMETE